MYKYISDADRINTGIDGMSLEDKQDQVSSQLLSLRFPAHRHFLQMILFSL